MISSGGELLGINSFLLKESQNLNFAVPATALVDALTGARALAGSLKFPKLPPIYQAHVQPPAAPPQNPSGPVPIPPVVAPPRSWTPPNAVGNLVRLSVAVTDKSGHLVANLPENAFTVFENGVPQPIRIFKREDVPISLALVLDNSAKMRRDRQALEISGLSLLSGLNPSSESFIVNFNDEAYLDVDFTGDIDVLRTGLARIDAKGGAAMRDAIRMSIDHLHDRAKQDKKVVIVVTDGSDDASLVPLDSLAKLAQRAGTLIYAIGLLDGESRTSAANARRELNQLTQSTGGLALYPKGLSVPEITRVAREIAYEIRNEYEIAYAPANHERDGSFHTITVAVGGRGGMVARTREGYLAK